MASGLDQGVQIHQESKNQQQQVEDFFTEACVERGKGAAFNIKNHFFGNGR